MKPPRPDMIAPDGTVWEHRPGIGYMPRRDPTGRRRRTGDRDARRATAHAKIVQALWNATAGMCAICGYRIDRWFHTTIDHVLPRSKGGKDIANMAPAHAHCNVEKSNRLPTGCEMIMLDYINVKLGVWL